MKDRAMQALYLMALEPIAETTGDTHSYGFRKKRSTWDAIEQCFKVLSKEGFATWILEGDIKGCFDHISHEWLESHIPTDKVMLHKWLKSGYILQKQLFATEEGTPQGGIISPTLANMTLDGLQKELSERFKKHEHKGKVYNPKVHMVRYADDFIITASTKELLEEEVMPLLTQFLELRGLTLSAEKTKITHIQDGFGFLGFNIRKYRKKLLIKPDKERCKKFLENVHNLISENRASTQEMLIYLLNPKIRGWGNYYRYSVASETFRNVDHQIHIKLWRWAKRRHPKKGNPWIVNKYYHSIGTNNWCFSTKKKDEKNKSRYAYINLRRLTEIKILKHIKVKHDANPFDPAWDEYFEKRETQKMLLSLKGQNRLLKIGHTQEKKVSKMRRAYQ
jgi:RNA-directed DNA polymerase